jgi:hypothetical protein
MKRALKPSNSDLHLLIKIASQVDRGPSSSHLQDVQAHVMAIYNMTTQPLIPNPARDL